VAYIASKLNGGARANDARDDFKESFGDRQGRELQKFIDQYAPGSGKTTITEAVVSPGRGGHLVGMEQRERQIDVHEAFKRLGEADTVKKVERAIKDLDLAVKSANEELALKKAKEGLTDAKNGLYRVHSEVVQLHKSAQLVGFEMKRLYSAKTLDEFNKAQEELNELLKAQEKRVAALGQAFSGITLRAQGLAGRLDRELMDFVKALPKEMQESLDSAFGHAVESGFTGGLASFVRSGDSPLNSEQAQGVENIRGRAGASFGSLVRSTTSTFANVMAETGDITAALQAAAPAMAMLRDIQKEWNFETNESYRNIELLYTTIENNPDIADSLSGITAELKGMADSGRLTKDRFNDLGNEAATQLALMTERGVDVDTQLMLMQPTLQALFEAQQRFGFATDDSTQKLIDMGIEHGIVGDQFKSVNQQMLDILVLIADALGADIPDAYRKVKEAAGDASQEQINKSKQTKDEIVKHREDLERIRMPRIIDDEVIDKSLDNAKKSIDSFKVEAIRAFREVGAEADAISFGHSPGGLKEIPIQIAKSLPAIRELHRHVSYLSDAQRVATGVSSGIEQGSARSSRGDTVQVVVDGGDTPVVLTVDGRAIADALVPHLPRIVKHLGLAP
jgi:hypothetical protein